VKLSGYKLANLHTKRHAPMLRASFFLAAILLLAAYGRWSTPFAAAQSGTVAWSEPVNLSNSLESSDHPAIITDPYGNVHVFWSEEAGGKPVDPGQQSRNGNSIFYTRWDGASWTTPRDVLFVPGEDVAEYVAVTLDDNNRLHVVWTGQTAIYYSSAPAWEADSPWAWSTPQVVATDSARSQWESSVVVDATGTVHIFYATRSKDPGVYHILSRDKGDTWEAPVKLSLPLDTLERGYSNVKAIKDAAGRLHVVWQTFQENGYGQAVYYARSVDGGESWNAPVQLGYRDPKDYEASFPYVVSVTNSELHLIYLDGPHQGRSQRISRDGGATWSEPLHIIDEMEGVNGYVVPVVDGNQQLHLIIDMRTRVGQVVGIYYAAWLKDHWSATAPVDVSDKGQHYTAAAVRLGNEIHVVYNQISPGEIWYVRGVLPDVKPTLALAQPVARPPVPTQLPTPVTATATPTSTPPTRPSVRFDGANGASAPSGASSDALAVLLPSLGSTLLLVGGTITWILLRSRKRSLR
jgi:hypothetical protein